MSRLSFRAKLLLVLFVPFLALVVVAAAGLSDRFTALHAQEQYGDLSAPLRSLDAASRALQDESVVSSWYVAADDRAADDRAERGPCPHRRRGARLPRQRAGLRRRRAEPGRRCPARGHEQGPRRHPGGCGARSTPAPSMPRRRATSSSTSTSNLLDFGERVARDLASADVSASLTRVFALERAQHELAREASVYISVLAGGGPNDFSEWVGAQTAAAAATATSSPTPRPPSELAGLSRR